jgi:hypothetical protein
MKMEVLNIDDEVRKRVNAVVEYAMSHWYRPASGVVPGDIPAHVCQLNDYRCVFSFTVPELPEGGLYRHLTISVPQEKAYPSVEATAVIAGLFGFTGWEKGVKAQVEAWEWMAAPHLMEHCVVIVQRIDQSRKETKCARKNQI